MIHNVNRIGNFTSSEIVSLTSMGKRDMTAEELAARPKTGKGSKTTQIDSGLGDKALTYIDETNMERRLGRSLTDEVSARPLLWGKLCEMQAFEKLGLEYIITSQETKVHPEIQYWAGSKDCYKLDEGGTVGDIKCPLTLKSFCQLVQPIYDGCEDPMTALRNGYTDKNGFSHPPHKDAEKYFWQLVSNACIEEVDNAELIVYMPYENELDEIKMMAKQSENSDKLGFIIYADDDELPYIKTGWFYKNINIIRFSVRNEDKDFLKGQVLDSGKLLINLSK